MKWYPTNDHILYTMSDLDHDAVVTCIHKDKFQDSEETTALLGHEVESIEKAFGFLTIDLKFTMPRQPEARRQTRELKLCLECENDLLWFKVETIERALKALGSSI